MNKTLALSVAAMLFAACRLCAVDVESVPLAYDLDRDANVSLLLTSQDGKVVRELLHGAARKKGANSESWDGLDEKGQPVSAGTYAWKLLSTQGLKAEYLLTLGTNPLPRWESWPGNHGPVAAVAVDETGIYAGTGCGEGTALCIKQDMNGQRLWTIPHWLEAWVGPTSMSVDNGVVYLYQLNGKLFRANASDGKMLPGSWDLGFAEDRKDSVFSEVSNISDVEAAGGQIVISNARQNLIRWIDPQDGKEIDRAAIPEPYGVAIDKADGSVVVISRGVVVRLSRADKTPKPVIAAAQLAGPRRLSIDPATRDILVAENLRTQTWVQFQYYSKKAPDPKTEQANHYYHIKSGPDGFDATKGSQLKRFSKDGAFKVAYGKPEGRRSGAYNPLELGGILDVTATPDGGFITVEEGLVKRTALWDASGKVVREWFGGWGYGQWAACDPDDPSIVWMPDRGAFLKLKVDYAKKTWRVLATYDGHDIQRYFGQDYLEFKIMKHGGYTYFFRVGAASTPGPGIMRLDETKGDLHTVFLATTASGHDQPLYMQNASDPLLKAMMEKKQKGQSYLWADRDNDGKPSEAEFRFYDLDVHQGGFSVDANFTYVFFGQDDELKNVAVYRWPLKEWKDGVPLYDPADCTKYIPKQLGDCGVFINAQGEIYTCSNVSGLNARNFGVGFWSPRASANTVSKWGKEGKALWTVGRHAAGSKAAPGEAKYFWKLLGETHGCIVANDVEESASHVWDQDGLWVGRLLDHPLIGPDSPASVYELCGENFGGSLFTDPKTGEVLYFAGYTNNVPVFRISGWDQFQRQKGAAVVTPALALKLKARIEADAIRPDLLHAGFLADDRIKLDGDLKEWSGIKPVPIMDGKTARAQVSLAWSPNWLYVAFDVTTTAPWKNASSEQLAFQGGAAVDVNLAPLGVGKELVPGVFRVVVAPVGGKTTAVEYMPVLSKEMSPPHSTREATFKTLNGSVTYQRTVAIGNAAPAVSLKPDGSGYFIELRIPRHQPYAFAPGARFRFDASVILADPKGEKSVMRLPWHSRDTGDMATQDTYMEALLRPQNWGEVVLE